MEQQFSYPRVCGECNCKVPSPVAYISHCSTLHPQKLMKLASDILGTEVSPAAGDGVSVPQPIRIAASDGSAPGYLRRMLSRGSNICYYVPNPGGEITIITGNGVLGFTADNVMLAQIAQLLSQSRFVVFGGPGSHDFLLRALNLNLALSFAADLFATARFIENSQART
jgi:hypothetical protein